MTTMHDNALDINSIVRSDTGTTIDYNTSLLNTQTNTWKLLTNQSKHVLFSDKSNEFLKKTIGKKFNAVVLYIDLVGSTQIVLNLPEEKIATIFSLFTYEMAKLISAHRGFVLKYVGDSVIGYFVPGQNGSILPVDDAVNCANSMIKRMKDGINPILEQYAYPNLDVRIGIDYGVNIAVEYGIEESQMHYDMIGRSMNMAAKIQGMGMPNQTLIGDDIYIRLHPNMRTMFDLVIWEDKIWNYQDREGNLYKVYSLNSSY